MLPYKRPVTQEEIFTALVKAEMDPAIQWTLRMMCLQFFRRDEDSATYADAELAMIYSDVISEEPGEHEAEQSCFPLCPGYEDNSPPNVSVLVLDENRKPCYASRASTAYGPVGLSCDEGSEH